MCIPLIPHRFRRMSRTRCPAIDDRTCRNVTVIFYDGIMFYKGFVIDDAISANPRPDIDQGMVHDDGSLSDPGMGGKYRPGEIKSPGKSAPIRF